MMIKDHILKSILSANEKIINHKSTLDPIILLPVIYCTILGILLLLIILFCCTKRIKHETDDDGLLELSTITTNHSITYGSSEINGDGKCDHKLPRKETLSPIVELDECNEELLIN